MIENLELTTTADGSITFYNPQIGENYHSKHGALQESLHVFVGSGLQYFLEQNLADSVTVLEVGFGTGLNFLTSANYCLNHKIKLNYTGLEAYPLNSQLLAKTLYNTYVDESLWQLYVNNYTLAFNNLIALNTYNILEIKHTFLLDFKTNQQFDVIYFDAFAAIHQPLMWDLESIKHTISFLKIGGIFVTYAITGNLKRMLSSLGMQIQKIKGAAGKREMLRAIKIC